MIADALAALFAVGTHAVRPVAATENTGNLYFETDTHTLFRSDGTTWLQIADAVGAGGLADGGVSTNKLAVSAVTTAKIADAAVTKAKADTGTTANKIVALDGAAKLPAVDGSNLTALNASNLSSGTVPSGALADGSITAAKLADSAVETAKIADGAVSTNKIADGTVTAAKIDTDSVPTLGAPNNVFSSTGNNFFRVRGDNITLFRTDGAYNSVGDIGFSASGGYRDGGAIRCLGAKHLQLSSDYNTADTDLDLHDINAVGTVFTPNLQVANNITTPNIYLSTGSQILGFAGIYGDGSVVHAYDTAGNNVVISPHPKDAPEKWYTKENPNPNIYKSANIYTGTIRWRHSDRDADIAQVWNSSGDPTNPADPHFVADRETIANETFAEYNARRGLKPTDPDYLTVRNWDADQAMALAKNTADRSAQSTRKVAVEVKRVAWAALPEPQRAKLPEPKFTEPEIPIYAVKAKPAFLE